MRGVGKVVAVLLSLAATGLVVLARSSEGPAMRPQAVPALSGTPMLGSPPDRPLVQVAAIEEAPPRPALPPRQPRAVQPESAIRTVEEKSAMEPMATPPSVVAPLDAEDLARSTLRSARGAFEACYEQSLRRDEKLRGRVVVEVDVQASGLVRASRIVESTVSDQRVMSCISSRLKQLRFPPLGADVELTVPFSLVPRL